MIYTHFHSKLVKEYIFIKFIFLPRNRIYEGKQISYFWEVSAPFPRKLLKDSRVPDKKKFSIIKHMHDKYNRWSPCTDDYHP